MRNIYLFFKVSKIEKSVICLSLAVLSCCSEKERLEGRDISLSNENTLFLQLKELWYIRATILQKNQSLTPLKFNFPTMIGIF